MDADTCGGSAGSALKRSVSQWRPSSQIRTPWDPSTLDTLQLVVDPPDYRIFVTVDGIEREPLSYRVPPTDRLKRPLDPTCIRVSTWMRSLGTSRTNSSHPKQRRQLCRWRAAAKGLKTWYWIRYGNRRIDYSRCSSLCQEMSGR